MKTRSTTQYEQSALFPVNINFDDASTCWRQNKKALGNGMYKYVCSQTKKDGTKCEVVCYKNGDTCWAHRGRGIIN